MHGRTLFLRGFIAVLVVGACAVLTLRAELPPAPAPPENPITAEKAILGKILFWEEQLSSNNAVSCGTCHRPTAGGIDPRTATNPGLDGLIGTPDDVIGSLGLARTAHNGLAVEDPVFGFLTQVTGRASMSMIGAAYAPELFWDGRAASQFLDPADGTVSIVSGGALENQAIGPPLSDVEMGFENRTWDEIIERLERSVPLLFASNLPQDVQDELVVNSTYADLFASAFGDSAITAERIAFALATYQRTLIPDDTPWDRFMAGDTTALTPRQQQGWNAFEASQCSTCHAPPHFTDHTFRNIGVRPIAEDDGRRSVTGLEADRGRFKVPSLRNMADKPNFMHNGQFEDMPAILQHYANNNMRFRENEDPLLPVNIPPPDRGPLEDFLLNGLTDPRVAAATAPFDHPTMHGGPRILTIHADKETIDWQFGEAADSFNVYRGALADLEDSNGDGVPDGGYGTCENGLDDDLTDNGIVDPTMPAPGTGSFYLVAVRAGGEEITIGCSRTGAERVPSVSCE